MVLYAQNGLICSKWSNMLKIVLYAQNGLICSICSNMLKMVKYAQNGLICSKLSNMLKKHVKKHLLKKYPNSLVNGDIVFSRSRGGSPTN